MTSGFLEQDLFPITLAVMSDLHVGIGARSKDLCPDHIATNAVESGYKGAFLEFLRKRSIRADYLVLPGDVSHLAQPAEFELASKFVLEVVKRLQVGKENIIFVPGNHDVDWTVLKSPDPTGFRRRQRYAPLESKDWIFRKIMKRASHGVLSPPHFCVWRFKNVFAVGYNSSWEDDPTVAIHHGGISDKHLAELDQHLASDPPDPLQVKIFLVHHHPLQYSDPIEANPDFSIMTNAGRLLDLLRRHNFDLLIHGHKHLPNFETHIVSSSSPLAVLCSGSFSVQLDTRWAGSVSNQFHLIHIDGRDADIGSIFGRVESWTYVCGPGWVPSKKPHHGIRHNELFGAYLLPANLKRIMRSVLEVKLKEKDYVEWSEVIEAAPNLKYLPDERAVQVVDSLAMELKFKRRGESVDEMILLVKK
ncbi:MAG: metallophosphoesterase [Acidobacteriia bacterium]|nr:metallophosphoesterase [Terriglobia bacterium]